MGRPIPSGRRLAGAAAASSGLGASVPGRLTSSVSIDVSQVSFA